MLRVTIEIVPFGDEDRKRTIGEVEIANVHTDHNNVADYEVKDTQTHETAEVEGHQRGQKNGLWVLLTQAMFALTMEKGGEE